MLRNKRDLTRKLSHTIGQGKDGKANDLCGNKQISIWRISDILGNTRVPHLSPVSVAFWTVNYIQYIFTVNTNWIPSSVVVKIVNILLKEITNKSRQYKRKTTSNDHNIVTNIMTSLKLTRNCSTWKCSSRVGSPPVLLNYDKLFQNRNICAANKVSAAIYQALRLSWNTQTLFHLLCFTNSKAQNMNHSIRVGMPLAMQVLRSSHPKYGVPFPFLPSPATFLVFTAKIPLLAFIRSSLNIYDSPSSFRLTKIIIKILTSVFLIF